MKTQHVVTFIVLVSMSWLLLNCQGILTNTGIPPLGTYFTFADKAKVKAVDEGTLLIERVDYYDTTRVIIARRSMRDSPGYLGLFSSNTYGYLFRFSANDSLFIRGWNKIRLTYPNSKDVDWLVLLNSAEEYVSPTQVTFNGKPLTKLDVNEPVANSYLYLLK